MYDYSASQGTTASWNQFLEDMALVLLDFNGDLPSLKNIWEGVSMFESMFPVTDPFFLFSQDSPQEMLLLSSLSPSVSFLESSSSSSSSPPQKMMTSSFSSSSLSSSLSSSSSSSSYLFLTATENSMLRFAQIGKWKSKVCLKFFFYVWLNI